MSSVYKPKHYTFSEIETINYIKDKLTNEEFIGYCIGNVMKYTSRYRLKGGKEDLLKASVYLGWAIDAYEKEEDDIELPLRAEVSE